MFTKIEYNADEGYNYKVAIVNKSTVSLTLDNCLQDRDHYRKHFERHVAY